MLLIIPNKAVKKIHIITVLQFFLFRFEQEIAEHPISRPVIATNTFHMASKAIQNAPKPTPTQDRPNNQFMPRQLAVHPPPLIRPSNHAPSNHGPPLVQGTINRVPSHIQVPMQHPVQVPPSQLPPPPLPPAMNLPPGIPPMVPQMVPNQALPGAPVMAPVMAPVGVSMVPVPMPVALPGMPVAGAAVATHAIPVMTAEEQREWESTYSQAGTTTGGKEKKKTKEKKFIRVAGDTVWEDNSLADWEQGGNMGGCISKGFVKVLTNGGRIG